MPESVSVNWYCWIDALAGDALALHLDALGQRELDGVRVAQGEDDLAALHVGLVADADHVHLLGEPFGHADDGVVGERAGQAVVGGVKSSDARSACNCPSSSLNVTPSGIGVRSVPFGPFTSSSRSLGSSPSRPSEPR